MAIAMKPWSDGSYDADDARAVRPLNVAVVGYGYWGPNLTRNISERSDMHLAALCERDPARIDAFVNRHPGVRGYPELRSILNDDRIDAVVVTTPPRTHHAIARAALEAGKHVLVEKPLATTVDEALDLVACARERELVLMPGHTFVYSPAVNAVRDLIRDNTLGEVYFVTSSRMNLGKYQADGVVCDLAPHDLSILMHWLGDDIVSVSASARSVFRDDVPETAFLTLSFAGGATANVQLSWLAPRKMRQTVLVGSRRMVQYDDTAGDEPIRVYDRGLDLEADAPATFGEYQLTYRTGDVVIPRVEPAEPLSLELADFARSIHTGTEPASSAALGVRIVAAMEAANESLRQGGAPVAPRADALVV